MRSNSVLVFALLAISAVVHSVAGQPKPPPPKPPDKPAPTERSGPSEIGGKTLSQWILETKSADAGVRENAVRTIILFGPAAVTAAPALIDRLSDTDVSLRTNAAIALTGIDVSDDDTPKAITALAKRVTDDPQAIVRYHAAVALGTFGQDARPAVPQLISASRDNTSWEIRKAAVYALGKTGAGDKDDPPDMRVANALIQVLGAEHTALVRLEAVMGLGSLGRPAKGSPERIAIEAALRKAVADRDRTVQIWAVVGLMAINDEVPELHLLAIAKLLKSPELVNRAHAARALGTIGEKAQSRVPDLVDMLNDKQREGILAALWALASMKGSAHKALPAIKELSQRKEADEEVKQAALFTIEIINGKKK